MVSGGGVFGGWLGHEGRALVNGISAIIKETQRAPAPSTLWGWSERMAANGEVGPHQTPNLPAPWFSIYQPPEL